MSNYSYTINSKYSSNVSLEKFMHDLPSLFENGGETLFQSRNTIKKFVLEDGLEIVVKKYKTPIFIQRVVYTFIRKSKAERAYINAAELMHRGIDTPENIAWASVSEGGLFHTGYFVSDVNDSPAIENALCTDDSFNKALAEDFAQFVAILHTKGIIHKDLNCTNVLFRPKSEGNYEFSLIDNNRMAFLPEGKEPSDKQCMENLTLFTGDLEVLRHVAIYYTISRGWDRNMADEIMDVKVSHDRKWRRKKKFLHMLSFSHSK